MSWHIMACRVVSCPLVTMSSWHPSTVVRQNLRTDTHTRSPLPYPTRHTARSVASGETEIAGADADGEGGQGQEAETADFESLFKLRVSILLESLFASHPDLPTRVVLVPSLNDVFHDHVFPQVRPPARPPALSGVVCCCAFCGLPPPVD